MDYEAAAKVLFEYFVRLSARYEALILVFQETMNDFNEFLSLPDKSNAVARYWDVASAVLSTVLPMLRVKSFAGSTFGFG